MSIETLKIVMNLGLTAADLKETDKIIRAMEQYGQGQINESVERKRFRARTQGPDEDFDDFLVSLRDLVSDCNFCNADCEKKAIRDQILEGLFDPTITERLLSINGLSLDKTIEKVRALSSAKKQRCEMSRAPPTSAAVKNPRTAKPDTPRPTKCGYCGDSHARGQSNCPASNSKCHICHKMGHYASLCRSG
ncbi:uncharacterized protein LOC117103011 [Anneissia japonica]|uniref:uncharacterized protein LOC117103011 n=1 Tax=Anneissia japonica TaxID=1529436 RepID=UPI001425A454|nr:uncharacterized protein LOC117103011 [Anneissia japonica]